MYKVLLSRIQSLNYYTLPVIYSPTFPVVKPHARHLVDRETIHSILGKLAVIEEKVCNVAWVNITMIVMAKINICVSTKQEVF